eukprot:TRINITY_DN1125_c0_g2_i1.p1 TRINITY_DN1125_c0_g2~~TRINITY_DN1125_c0_g2_i1.p1  ORF type:complete len:119 (-),score=31.26 TRINITY_DN1125_c0_g2_i1:912-1268(-)
MDDCDPEKSFLGPNIGEKVYVLIDGPLEELEEYLKQDGKDLPESHDNKIRNLLGYAVASNRIDHVKLLLDKGANPDILGVCGPLPPPDPPPSLSPLSPPSPLLPSLSSPLPSLPSPSS